MNEIQHAFVKVKTLCNKVPYDGEIIKAWFKRYASLQEQRIKELEDKIKRLENK